MANYRKSFNFRTGLQVDNDNFVVNANGLVGIGTSTPENYLLNVYGDTRVTGVTTTANLIAGVGTVSTLTANSSSLGVASVTSIQIAGGPVLTNLVGYAYSTFIDDAVGGISTTSRIGIGTTADTGAKLKVLGDSIFTGNIDASTGIVTASSFVGNITGTVTGTATTATNLANAANITTGTIDDARLPDIITSNINVSSGISTINDVRVGSAVTIHSGGINIPSGIVTATTFVGNLTGIASNSNGLSDGANIFSGTIPDARLPDLITSNIDISSGISTFNNIIASNADLTGGIVTATTFVGGLTGTATTATALSGTPDITVGDVSATNVSSTNVSATGIVTATTELDVASAVTIHSSGINIPSGIVTATTFVGSLTGTATTATALSGTPDIGVGIATASSLSVSGIITSTTEINVGTDGSGVTALSTGNIGIGTTNPTSELLIRKTSGSLLEVISDNDQARISIGNSVGVGKSTGLLRFGNSANVFEIINNDVGDIRTIIHSGTGAGSTGNFKWIYGQTNAERMTLTYDGNLGINNVSPSQRLSVGGGVTITGNTHIDGDLTLGGNLSATISYPSLISGTNLNNTSGITTLAQLDITSTADFSYASQVSLGNTVAIGTGVGSTEYGLRVTNGINANIIEVTDGINVGGLVGFVTALTVCATGGFKSTSTDVNAIQINYASSPDRIEFNVVGIGSTSLLLV